MIVERHKLESQDEWIQNEITAGNHREALEGLVRQYQHRMVCFCKNMLDDASLAEDIAQEVFLAAFTAMPRFRQNASVRTWLFAIARKKCLQNRKKWWRRRHLERERQEEIAEKVHPDPPPLENEREYLIKLVGECLKHLSERERQLLMIRYYHKDKKFPIAEMANVFMVSVSTMRRRLAPAMRNLKECVDEKR